MVNTSFDTPSFFHLHVLSEAEVILRTVADIKRICFLFDKRTVLFCQPSDSKHYIVYIQAGQAAKFFHRDFSCMYKYSSYFSGVFSDFHFFHITIYSLFKSNLVVNSLFPS
nr:MAG TPA: hypothetical protein [Caudoviricetes sp.]